MSKTVDTQKIVDAVVTAASVAIGLFILSFLDAHHMPLHGLPLFRHLKCDDVKFYSPPHAAIAFIFFNSESMPKLNQWGVGIIVSTIASIVVVEVSQEFQVDPIVVRCMAVGLAVTVMKLLDQVFAPAAAIAVLFADNAVMRGHGKLYALMPGLSGTAVLFVLAYAKVKLMENLRGKAKTA